MTPPKGSAQLRANLVQKFGDACKDCGYSRCARALHFHHMDGSEKREWSRGRGHASLAEIAAHPERFVLVCANCHIERHTILDEARRLHADCRMCGKTFRTVPHRGAHGRGVYCSRKCTNADRTRIALGTVHKRFWKQVEKTAGCWLWTGCAISGGGVVNVTTPDGRHVPTMAARISYEMHIGAIPPKKRVQRRCRDSRCVNPEHLYVTQ